MSIFDEGRDMAEKFAREHPEKADEVIERGEEFADERTGHRFDKQIDAAGERAEEFLTGDDPARRDDRPPTP
jgi:hypothetical protein